MTLSFRNVDASPEDPVATWPAEGVQAALERGSLRYWRRLAEAVRADPWGSTTRTVEQVLSHSRPYVVAELMEQVIADARRAAAAAERAAVAEEICSLWRASGLTREEFASRVGTSASRLSTYMSAKVVPSAALIVRMRRVVSDCAERWQTGVVGIRPEVTAEDRTRFARQTAAVGRIENDDEGDPQWRTDMFEAIDQDRERRGLPALKTEPEFHRLAGALGLLRR